MGDRIKKMWTTRDFAENNLFCKEFKNINIDYWMEDKTEPLDHVRYAVFSHFQQIISGLMLNPLRVIEDSLAETCRYIEKCVSFVHELAQHKNTEFPFQFDCVFAFDKVQKREW